MAKKEFTRLFDLSALSVGEIRVYADLPFRGKEHPMVIPSDEMVELIKSGKAKMKLRGLKSF